MPIVRMCRFARHGTPAMILLGAALALPIAAAAQTATKTGTVTSVDTAHHQMSITTEQTFTVVGDGAADKLGTLVKGDTVRFDATDKKETQAGSIQKKNDIVNVSWLVRVVAGLVVILLVMLIAHLIAKWGSGKTVSAYFVGIDGRVSNSQTQLALWGATVFVVYLTTVALRIYYGYDHFPDTIGGVGIPTNLLALSGLSALTFGGARAVTVSKNNAAKAANAAGPAVRLAEKEPSKVPADVRDLFRNDANGVDLGDTQMILITAIAIVIYAFKTFSFLGHIELSPAVMLPDVDTTLLAGFGVGQGAYLAKKAASDLGKG